MILPSRRDLTMLVTDAFVYLHQPKTGGTFVAEMLGAIHESRGLPMSIVTVEPGQEHSLQPVPPGHAVRLMLGTRYQHGARRDIPPAYRHLPVVATIRHPFDRYISQFEFAWWRVYPEMFGPIAAVQQRYPDYPELTFSEFVRLTNEVSVRRAADPDAAVPGFHTQQFIEYFFREPEQAWAVLGHTDALRAMFDGELRGLTLLDQANLNEELATCLEGHGYSADEVERIRDAGRIRPVHDHTGSDGWTQGYSTRLGTTLGHRQVVEPASEVWRRYLSPDIRAFLADREQLLFERFPQFER